MEWTKHKEYVDCYYTSREFNGYTYNTVISVEVSDKSVKYYVAVSSGKKRRDFDIFEEKSSKSFGGIRALFWIKEAMYDFPKFYSRWVENRNQYICIGWADSRRRDIYKRLEKRGFQFMIEGGRKILMKKL